MSEDWSKPRDIDPLADGQVSIDFAIAIADFPRLRPQLARTEGRATGRVRFARERSIAVASVEVAARAELICQRCLGPLAWAVRGAGKVAMVANAAEADRVPGELDTILAPDHRISVRDLAEEELLLALPIVPLHAARECAAPGQAHAAAGAGAGAGAGAESPRGERTDESRHRPFERLDELVNEPSKRTR